MTIMCKTITDHQKDILTKRFKEIDKNNDGEIDKEEMKEALTNI